MSHSHLLAIQFCALWIFIVCMCVCECAASIYFAADNIRNIYHELKLLPALRRCPIGVCAFLCHFYCVWGQLECIPSVVSHENFSTQQNKWWTQNLVNQQNVRMSLIVQFFFWLDTNENGSTKGLCFIQNNKNGWTHSVRAKNLFTYLKRYPLFMDLF